MADDNVRRVVVRAVVDVLSVLPWARVVIDEARERGAARERKQLRVFVEREIAEQRRNHRPVRPLNRVRGRCMGD